jgi:hypothetical protein
MFYLSNVIPILFVRSRGRHQKHCRVIAVTLRYIFEFSHNASTLRRKVIAYFSSCSRFIEIVIASYSYRYKSLLPIIGIVIAFYSYRSRVTKSSSLLLTTSGFLPSGMNLTGLGFVKGRQLERCSVLVITLRCIFALSHNASTLWRKVNAF